MLEYFILKFYTYLDIYTIALFQFVISKVDTDKVFDLLPHRTNISNPYKMIIFLLKNIPVNEGRNSNKNNIKNLHDLTELVFKEEDWLHELNYFDEFMRLRNLIAHRKKIASMKDIVKSFPSHSQIIEKKVEVNTNKISTDEGFIKLRDFLDHLGIEQEKVRNLLSIKEEIKYLYTIPEIAKSCVKIVAYVDNVIVGMSNDKKKLNGE